MPFYKRRGPPKGGQSSGRLSRPTSNMTYPTDRKYTKDHEWIRVTGDTAEIGITDYAQQQLGDVVYVELPDVGQDDRRPASRSDRSSR